MKKSYRRMRPLLGTFVEVGTLQVPGHEEAVTSAFLVIEEIQKKMSFHDPKSELSKLNASQGEWIQLSSSTVSVLRLARWIGKKSGSLFNSTMGGKIVESGHLPNHNGASGPLVGDVNDIEIRGRKVRRKRSVQVTLDGIAKGFAVDRAVKEMKKRGMTGGWINAGGDLRVFGNISIPIHRRELNDQVTYLGDFAETAVATSSVRLAKDPRFPGHIVAAKENAVEGVWTVSAPSAWLADALTKVACLAPEVEKISLVEKLNGRMITPATRVAAYEGLPEVVQSNLY